MKVICVAAALAIGLISTSAAQAEPGLGGKVYDPYIKNGVWEIETRAGQLQGGALDGEAAAVVELEKGINDRISLALVGEFEKHVGEKRKFDSIGVEMVTYLGQLPGGIDVGGYLEYEQRIHNESGVGEAKLLLAKTSGNFQGLVNLIGEKAFNNLPSERYAEYSYAASATWEVIPRLRAGVEAFGDLGTRQRLGGYQPHYVGPKVFWESRPEWLQGAEIEFEAAYLFAAGSARDETNGQARLMVELEKRF